MKKFLAVLLAVALLGVAGAAFAVGHGHTYDSGFSTNYSDADVASADALGIVLVSGDIKIEDSSQTSTAKTVAALAKLSNLKPNTTYGFNIDGLASKLVDPIVNTTKLYDGEITASVVVAGVANEGTFYNSNWEKIDTVTDLSAIKHASFKTGAAQTEADLSVAADKDPGGPTSNKGSGGCNAGFAGLAVLALSALALRRKAR